MKEHEIFEIWSFESFVLLVNSYEICLNVRSFARYLNLRKDLIDPLDHSELLLEMKSQNVSDLFSIKKLLEMGFFDWLTDCKCTKEESQHRQ